ncbi:TrbI/VirB10 family protein [Marinicella sp. W31]|uniref:TrbI/VirB10 family protein n=1 Tax=Marinicella sp. W31 TaxID=3023713 RepID=UPI0037575B11
MNDTTKQLEDEKSIPSVGKTTKTTTKYTGILFLACFAALIIYVILSGDKKSDSQSSQSSEYRPSGYTSTRNFSRETPIRPKNEAKKDELSTAELKAILDRQKELQDAKNAAIEAEEMRRLAEIEDAKRRSKISVFKSGSKAQNTGAVAQRRSNTNPTSTEEGRLNLGSSRDVETAYAVRLRDMDKTIAAGKFIHAVLETAIDSTLPGQVRATVSDDIYSENGSTILIPKGSRLVGEYRSSINQGQERVFVIWSHVTTKDGIQVGLESSGTDALGVAGMSGDYDSHFFKRFSGALLLSFIESYAEKESDSDNFNINSGNSLQRASSIALNNSINIKPTIYVDQGEIVNVFVARNIDFGAAL